MRFLLPAAVVLLEVLAPSRDAQAQPWDLGTPEVILTASWGSGPGQVAHKDGSEGASLGPMSFAFGPDGTIYILDQVNGRLAVFRSGGGSGEAQPVASVASGRSVGASGTAAVFDRFISIPGTTFEEIEVAKDGRILLLDRLVRESLVILDPRTKESEEFPVVGMGIREGGGVTALLAREDGVWLEYSREHSVHVLDSRWLPCEREIVAGRPARHFRGTLEASLGVAGGADVRIDANGSGRGDGPGGTNTSGGPTRDAASPNNASSGVRQLFVQDDEPIGRLIELADGPGGAILLVYHCWRWADDGDALAFQEVRGRWYGANGSGLATLASPHTLSEWEQFREFRVLPDGSAVQMAFSQDGVKLLKWRGP